MDELQTILETVSLSVERELALEDQGWIKLGAIPDTGITDAERITAIKRSRRYTLFDPLARQAIRLWTDYTFGSGMTWQAEDEGTQEALAAFWEAPANQSVLSVAGQRLSSDKLLVDGEIFFALFLGAEETTIRRIDPLEITGIITNPEDSEDVRFYKRDWTKGGTSPQTTYYRSLANIKGESTVDSLGATVKHNDKALVYHLKYNTIGQRGNPLLLPALDWIKYYRQFLASRIAIMLALARFAWHSKVTGGAKAVAATQAVFQDQSPDAGSVLVENLGSDTQPIRTDTGASQAYQDGRMLKLQVAAAVGLPEQYFGDISIGNLATAKTVELPMMKMFQSYQAVWADTYKTIDGVVLDHAGITPDKWYVDRDFPAIAPEDVAQVAQSLMAILQVLPQLADIPDVQQVALLALGVNDPGEVLSKLTQEAKSEPQVQLAKALRRFTEAIKGNGHMPNLRR